MGNSNIKIAIIDNDSDFLFFAEKMFEVNEYHVKTGTDFEEIGDINNFSLVISEVKSAPVKILHSNTPIIGLYEGDKEEKDIVNLFRKGFSDLLKKPVFDDELFGVIHNHVNNKHDHEDIDYSSEVIKYRTLLDKRTGELVLRKNELEKANEKIIELNNQLKKKIDPQFKAIITSEIQASYGKMIQGIIHNMNTPISTIKGGLDLLSMSFKKDMDNNVPRPDYEKYRKRIERLMTGTDNLIDIVKNMKTRSKNESVNEPVDIDINELIENELEFLRSNMFFKHQVKKDINLTPSLPKINAIYSEISLIIGNVVSNALDAMYDTPIKEIIIKSELNGKNIDITVQDSGSGISSENIDKIFDIFYTTKKNAHEINGISSPTGNGVGLYIVKELIKKYNGNIKFSTKQNSGTKFILSFPISSE